MQIGYMESEKPTNKRRGLKNFQCEMLNIEFALPFTIHVHDRRGRFEWIRY
jgi:hypothetical protein